MRQESFFGGDAEAACFSACFNGAVEHAVRFFPDDLMLSVHFDRGRKSPKLDALIDRATKSYRGSPAIVNLSYNRVIDFTPLQAADIIATENYWHVSSVIAGNDDAKPRPHFFHFLQRVKATNGYLAQEQEILDTLKKNTALVLFLRRFRDSVKCLVRARFRFRFICLRLARGFNEAFGLLRIVLFRRLALAPIAILFPWHQIPLSQSRIS